VASGKVRAPAQGQTRLEVTEAELPLSKRNAQISDRSQRRETRNQRREKRSQGSEARIQRSETNEAKREFKEAKREFREAKRESKEAKREFKEAKHEFKEEKPKNATQDSARGQFTTQQRNAREQVTAERNKTGASHRSTEPQDDGARASTRELVPHRSVAVRPRRPPPSLAASCRFDRRTGGKEKKTKNKARFCFLAFPTSVFASRIFTNFRPRRRC